MFKLWHVVCLTCTRASFSADWGDYVSFAKHLRDRADADGSDLLLIDTGDRVEGNAIYDSSKPRGKFTYEIAKEQNIDLICSGNHELYKANTAEGEYYHTVPDFKGNYLASNLDIYNPKSGNLEPLAPRYKKFTTKNQGIRILAFGFLFDFTGNANNTVVQRVEDTVKEAWFKEALKDKDVDLIIVSGHVDIRSEEYALLFSTIRSSHWDTPIQFFGGHSHIRDFKIFDSKSVAMESGRYMETLGFMSIDGLSTGGKKNASPVPQKKLNFSRRYIDNNLFSMKHHSGKDSKTFPTEHGTNVSAAIGDARKSLGLGKVYGCAPQDLWVSRRPYPHNESIFTWIEEQLLPQTIKKSKRIKEGRKALVVTNTGAIRFDIFKGTFTKDTKFLVSPFTSPLRYIKDVPYKAASQVLKLLNHEGPIMLDMAKANAFLQPPEVAAACYRPHLLTTPSNTFAQPQNGQAPMLEHEHDDEEPKPFPGYTTSDDAGTDGDDTVHSPIQFYNVPNCIQASVDFDSEEPETVDLMYNAFIEKWVLLALDYLGARYGLEDTQAYDDGKSFTDIMTEWVSENWGWCAEEWDWMDEV
jgi:hypothetical protein